MKKKFSSTLSITLAGLLAVGGIGVSPMTAYAAYEPTATAAVNDKIQFAASTSVAEQGGALKKTNNSWDYTKPLTVIGEADAVPAENKVILTTPLPTVADVLGKTVEQLTTGKAGYEFAWINGDQILVPNQETGVVTDKTIGHLEVLGDSTTITGDLIGKQITVTVFGDHENPATGTPLAKTKRYKTETLASAIDDPADVVGYEFVGWDLNNDNRVDLEKGKSAADQSDAIDAAAAAPGTDFDNTVDLKGVWDPKSVTVTFDANGADSGTKTPDNQENKKYDQLKSGAIGTGTLKKTGYELEEDKEWAVVVDGKTVEVPADTTYADLFKIKGVGTTIALKANWKNTTKYAVTLNNTSFEGAPSIKAIGKPWDATNKTIVRKGDKIKLPEVTDTVNTEKNQISFEDASETATLTGWDTQNVTQTHEAAVVYQPGEEIAPTADLNLYPVFVITPAEKKPVTITLDNNSANAGVAGYTTEQEELKDQLSGSEIYPENPFTAPENMHFVGWDTRATATSATYTSTYKYKVPSSAATLYAIWAPDTFNVEFYTKANTDAAYTKLKSDVVAFNDEESTLQSASGYNAEAIGEMPFVGWATSNTAKNAEYPNSVYTKTLFTTKDATVRLYAVYTEAGQQTPIKYASKAAGFKWDGTTEAEVSDAIQVAKKSTFKLNAIATATDKKLVGWTLDKDYVTEALATKAKVRIYPAGSEFAIEEPELEVGEATTFYAVFRPTYTVTYHGNGATYPEAPIEMKPTVTEDTSVALSKSIYVNTGSVFKGWNTNEEKAKDGIVEFTDEQTISISGNIDAWAVWEAKVYNVVYDKNNDKVTSKIRKVIIGEGSNTVASTTAVVGDENLSWADDAGLTLLGWALTSDSTKAKFTANDHIDDVIDAAEKEGLVAEDGTITLYAVYKVDDVVKAKEDAEAEAEEAKKAAEKAEAAKAEADKKAADAETAKAASDKKAADAETAKTAAEAAKAASDKKAADAATDAANQKKIADAAKADAATQKAAAEAANKKVAAQFETLKKVEAANGYVVNTFKNGEATLVSIPAAKTKATMTLASKVKVNGKTYKVTKIAAKALKTNTKIKTVTVPATVKQIGANAFGSKVTKLTVKGSNVQVLNNALKSINKKAKVIAKNKYTRTQLQTFGNAKKTVKFSAK